MRPLYSNAITDRAVAADQVDVLDLGVNPLSAIYINIKPLNETSTAANYKRYLDICASLNAVRLLYKGQSVVNLKGEDLCAMNLLRRNIEPRDINPVITDNVRRFLTLPILLGRFAGDPVDCFPAVRRGDLTLELDWDIADTGYDGMRYSVDTLEILDAKPKFYERTIAINQTFGAVGQNNITLPIGNPYRGMLLWGTTGYAGASPAPSFGRIQLLMDNQQYWVSAMDFENAQVMSSVLGGRYPNADNHQHTSAAAASPTSNRFDIGLGGWEKYAFLDFDLTRDDLYSIPTAGANQWILRADAETADAVRVIPVERVAIG